MSAIVVNLNGLTKKYENRAVVDHINLMIRKGENLWSDWTEWCR